MTSQIIGSTTFVDIVGIAKSVPAKVDTGADRSSIDTSNVFVDEQNRLHFTLFHPGSPLYTGEEIVVAVSRVSVVKSSTGHKQVRYRAPFIMKVEGRLITVDCNLSNRSQNTFPILIGRRTLKGKFLVDVAKQAVKIEGNTEGFYNKEMKKNPHAFFKKYHDTKKEIV